MRRVVSVEDSPLFGIDKSQHVQASPFLYANAGFVN
jgi:hypothetical protein